MSPKPERLWMAAALAGFGCDWLRCVIRLYGITVRILFQSCPYLLGWKTAALSRCLGAPFSCAALSEQCDYPECQESPVHNTRQGIHYGGRC